MKLKELPVLLIDGQTTGMRPSSGQLIELAWTVTTAQEEAPSIESHFFRLPKGENLPYRIAELTGICDADLAAGQDSAHVLAQLQNAAARLPEPKLSVIHYAQFEKPFLLDLFGDSPLPFAIVCSHALTKKLFPNLPSMNIRGTAGFFGNPVAHLKRGTEHVRATADIWRGLVHELAQKGIEDWPALQEFLAQKNKTPKGRYAYRLPSEKRLALPDAPGIYRMIAKNGEVLYVGKATSLKSRVNSYFRGKAGRDKRKLEMMAQVWDLNVTECRSALEAALMEADEIKKFNPPYNVVMKKGKRHLIFYSRDFTKASRTQDAKHPVGPFRNMNWIEHLRILAQKNFAQVFFEPIPADQAERAFELFCQKHKLPTAQTTRQLLAWGLNSFRNYVEESVEETLDEDDSERPYTDQEVRAKYERLLRRAGGEHWRAKKMTKLLNSRVTYQHGGQARVLDFRNGLTERLDDNLPKPWHDLGVETFDRMSVLLSELEKYEHHVEWTKG